MAVNYEDERFQQVEADKKNAMTELEQTYAGIIGDSDSYYQAQIDASKQWADKQSQLQQEQTDFTIEQVEQQKQQAHKSYVKEQSGAYVDRQKQSDQYGVAAEQQAAGGMTNTGYSESSQVSMYNTYQNRVATARESYNQAILNYDNAIKDARLQNNSVLAEIAYQALQTQLELSLEGFQYKNNLILEQANKKVEMDNMYYQRYQDVLDQINTENAMAEEIRQFNMNYQMQEKQLAEDIRQFEKSYQMQVKQFEEEKRQWNAEYKENIRQFNEEIARLKAKDAKEYEMQIKQLELQKQQLAEQKKQHDAEMAYKEKQLEEQKRQFDAEVDLKNKQLAAQSTSNSYGGGSGSKKTSTSTSKKITNTTSKTTTNKTTTNKSTWISMIDTYNKMISNGASKSQVLSDITSEMNKGNLTPEEARKLKEKFVPKGIQY